MKTRARNKDKKEIPVKGIQFSDIFILEDIQNLQDLFSDTCGVASIITLPDGTPITKPSNFCRLCSDVIRKTEKGLANCLKSDAVLGRQNSSGPIVQPCLSGGLWDAGASITVGGKHIANWLIGQVRNGQIDETYMMQYSDQIGANKKEFSDALKEVPVMSVEQFNKVSKMLFAFANELSEKAYKNLQLNIKIDERRKAEDSLIENENKFRNIFENAKEGIFQTNIDGSYISVNPALAKMYGYDSPEELIKSRTDISKDAYYDPGERDNFLKIMEKQGFVKGYEYEVKHKDGHKIWFYEDAQTIKDEKGETKYFEGFVIDITERKKAEEKMLLISKAVDSTSDAIGISDAQGHHFYQNRALTNLFGFETAEELDAAGGGPRVVNDPEVASEMFDNISRGMSWSGELDMVTKSGRVFPAFERADAIKDNNGNMLGLIGIITNIEDRKNAEKKLIESEERYKRIADGLTDYLYTVIVKNGEAVNTFHSKACETVTGYTSDEFLTDPYLWINMVVPEEREKVAGRFLKILAGEDLPPFEHRIIHKDGSIRWISDTAIPKYDENHKLMSYDGVIKDISERKQAEETLRASEEKHRLLIENSYDIIYTLTSEGIFTFVSPAWTTLLGHPVGAVTGHSFQEFVHLEDLLKCLVWLKKIIDSGQRHDGIEYRVQHTNGTWHWHTSSAVPFKDETGSIIGFYGTARDITERKLSEEKLLKSEQMLKAVLDNFPGIVFWKDIHSTYLGCNQAFANGAGLKNPSEIINKTDFDLPWATTEADNYRVDDFEVMKNGKEKLHIIEMQHQANNKIMWVDTSKIPICDSDGNVIGLVGVSIDITKSKVAEEALRENNSRLDLAMKSAKMAWWEMDIATGAIVFDQRKAEMLGYKSEKFKHYKDFMALVHPEDYNHAMSAMKLHFSGKKERYETEYRIKTQTGEYKWFYDIGTIVKRDSKGKPLYITGLVVDITDRKLGEIALRESENKFRNLVWDIQVGILLQGPKSEILLSNPKALELLGLSEDQLLGKTSFDPDWNVIHEDGTPFPGETHPVNQAIFSRTPIRNVVMGVYQPDRDNRVWLLVDAVPQLDNNGSVRQVVCSFIDISERKKAEQELVYTKALLNTAFEQSPIPMALASAPDLVYRIVNSAAAEFLQINATEYVNKPLSEIKVTWKDLTPEGLPIKPSDLPMPLALSGIATKNIEIVVERHDGSKRWEQISGAPIFDPEGNLIAGMIVFQDISERKAAEMNLSKSEDRYRSFVSQVSEGVYRLESDVPMDISMPLEEQVDFIYDHLFIVECNDSFMRMYGFVDQSEIIGKGHLDFHGGRYNEVNRNLLRGFIRSGYRTENGITEENNNSGQTMYISNNSLGIIENNHLVRIWGTQSDITERKRAEEALRDSEEKLSTLFGSMTEMVALHDIVFNEKGEAINYRIIDCNNAYLEITGIKKESAIGKLATDVYQTENPPYLVEFSTVGITGVPYEYNTYFAPMDKHFMISVVSPKKNQFATITTDVTAIRQIQDMITAKNKELENYLYVASHDLRSPLVNIQGFSQRLQKQSEAIKTFLADCKLDKETEIVLNKITNDDIPKTLNFILSNVTKMDALINGLLQISRTGRIKMVITKVDMDKLFKSILASLNFQIVEQSAKVNIENLPVCYGDENQLNQLFTNLIGNAIKYSDKERKLVINIASMSKYNKVVYSIADTGIGIAGRHIGKIWDVFYRVDSASPQAGEGIGLSLAKRITEKHKGKIWVESEEGKGSTFYVELHKNVFTE
jgi:PAS domain S-box-containing protein